MAKKTKKKINKKGLIVVLLTLYLLIMVFYYVFTLPVKNIIVKGNNLVSTRVILENAKISDNDKLITLNKYSIIKNIKDIELIDEVHVNKSLNGNLIIEIKEAKVLFYNILNKTYALSNGKEVSNLDSILGIPTLVNYIPSDIYENLIKKMLKIDNDIISLISEIEYSPDIKNEITINGNRFLFRMNDGNFVYIDLANFDNISKYKTIYATLDDEKGVLNLDSSSDQVIFTTFASLESKVEESELSE